MNRQEFMTTLKKRLECLPADEKSSAINYYEEFFDDAGVENEQSVIKNLGSPDDLADSILKSSGYFIETKSNEENQKQGDNTNNAFNNNQNAFTNPIKKPVKTTSSPNWVVILILIITFPFWIGLVGMAFGLIVMLFALLFSLAVVVFVIPFALIVSGILCIGYSPVASVFCFGLAALSIGILLLIIPFVKLLFKGMLNCIKGVCRSIGHLFTKREMTSNEN